MLVFLSELCKQKNMKNKKKKTRSNKTVSGTDLR